MKFADFIHRDSELILVQWEAFARSFPAAKTMNSQSLRNHAYEILEAICKDLASAQSSEQQMQKSMGLAPPLDARETAAQTHALLRARNGFNVNEMVSEYRALRASVLSLWIAACLPGAPAPEEMIRFNEAIDQAMAESLDFFSKEVDRARDLLLGILGHDLRNPLNAIQLTARHLQSLNAGEKVSAAAARLVSSGARMKALLDDLTDFNRTRLGLGITVSPREVDLREVFEDEISLLMAAHPKREITLVSNGDLRGCWDPNRLHQVLGNLVVNALRYGAPDKQIQVTLDGRESEVIFSVLNHGNTIAPETLAHMFEPLQRGADRPTDSENLGLGLYICRQIVLAHGGDISVRSSNGETSFSIRMPKARLPDSAMT